MTNLVTMRVQLVAYTHFDPPTDLGWETDAEGSEALTEFAGRACYETWDKRIRILPQMLVIFGMCWK